MNIILCLRDYFESNFGLHYPIELVYYITGLYQKIVLWKISCGISHNFLLTNNKIYSWGANYAGQSRFNHRKNQRRPLEIKFDFTHIVDIACGNQFSIAKTSIGEIYIWGSIGSTMYHVPTKINLNNVRKICCNEHHYFVLADESVYVLEENYICESVIEIACGYEHYMALASDYQIYGWGSNRCGQLGLGRNSDELIPQKVNFPNCMAISCGANHSLILTTVGEVYSCGFNNFGQLGVGDEQSRNQFQKLELKNIRAIHGKGAHSMCLTNDNELYAWGFNSCGELGLGHYHNQKLPQKVQLCGISNIDSGYSYAIAVTLKNEVYVWGKNTCGELGLDDNKDYTTPQRLQIK